MARQARSFRVYPALGLAHLSRQRLGEWEDLCGPEGVQLVAIGPWSAQWLLCTIGPDIGQPQLAVRRIINRSCAIDHCEDTEQCALGRQPHGLPDECPITPWQPRIPVPDRHEHLVGLAASRTERALRGGRIEHVAPVYRHELLLRHRASMPDYERAISAQGAAMSPDDQLGRLRVRRRWPARVQVKQCGLVSPSDRDCPRFTGRSGTQRARVG